MDDFNTFKILINKCYNYKVNIIITVLHYITIFWRINILKKRIIYNYNNNIMIIIIWNIYILIWIYYRLKNFCIHWFLRVLRIRILLIFIIHYWLSLKINLKFGKIYN